MAIFVLVFLWLFLHSFSGNSSDKKKSFPEVTKHHNMSSHRLVFYGVVSSHPIHSICITLSLVLIEQNLDFIAGIRLVS